MGGSLDSVVVELDKPRPIRFTIPGQIELEEKSGLGMLELAAKLSMNSVKMIRLALWIGLKAEDPKLAQLSSMDALMEKGRLREIEIEDTDAQGIVKRVDGVPVMKKAHVNNAYISGKVLDALRKAGAFGEPAEEPAAEETTEDPSPAPSPSS